jgi:hypothetical protein
MEAEKVMELFESLWFFNFNIKKSTSDSLESANSNHEITIPGSLQHRRSMSHDQTMTMIMTTAGSPDSVLIKSPRTLHTIVSGKESTVESNTTQVINQKKAIAIKSKKRRSRSNYGTKSMSDLEFEELKGLMDLGFIFSEEDNKDPRLLEIVPGLHRLSANKESSSSGSEDGRGRRNESRPYLSETWQVFEYKKQSPILKDWKIPSSSVEIDMKKNLRSWAHVVASTIVT